MVVKFVALGSPESDTALLVHDVVARFGKTAGLKPEHAQLILQSVPSGSAYYAAPVGSIQPGAYFVPKAAQVPSANLSSQRSIEEVYASLPSHERARVDAMPFNEQYAYLRSKR